VIVGAVLTVLLLAGGGIWLATGDDGSGRKPLAGPSADTGEPGTSPTTGEDDDGSVAGPTAAELDAGRKAGEAKVAWLAENGVDLPEYGEETHGPWFAGDVVAKGMYRKVTGYAVADGAESALFESKAVWQGGRSFLFPERISEDEDEDEEEKAATAVLVFGK